VVGIFWPPTSRNAKTLSCTYNTPKRYWKYLTEKKMFSSKHFVILQKKLKK
jgi:hypothetical protein